jgi:hypothetical protein
MTEKITLNLTLKELQQIDKFVEVNDDTLSVLMKIKNAYPQPKMHLENEGEFSIVSYDGNVYYRLEYPTPTAVVWYRNNFNLVFIEDIKTKNELESQWLMNDVKYQRVPDYIDDPEYCSGIEWDEKDNPKPKTIRSIIDRWWIDTFTTHSKWDAEECMDDLADQIEFFYMRNKK